MKYLLLLLLGMLLGALAYREYDAWYSAPAPATATKTGVQTTEAELSHDRAPVPTAPRMEPDPTSGLPPPINGTTPQPAAAVTADRIADAGPGLLLPVQGVTPEQLSDTFTDARSQARRHDAIDIMAPAGTPVLAVADGNVEKLFTSDRGGLTLYQFEPSGRLAYYYAHLQRYADGIAEGQNVRRGQVIGYVGNTGNASPDAPHLHFAVFVLGPERHWWEGQAINPYPLLRGESTRQAP